MIKDYLDNVKFAPRPPILGESNGSAPLPPKVGGIKGGSFAVLSTGTSVKSNIVKLLHCNINPASTTIKLLVTTGWQPAVLYSQNLSDNRLLF